MERRKQLAAYQNILCTQNHTFSYLSVGSCADSSMFTAACGSVSDGGSVSSESVILNYIKNDRKKHNLLELVRIFSSLT